jgi:glycosyltransferase involved in cell wall biosynthesis
MALRIGMVAYTHYESDPRVRREAEALAARGDEVLVWCLRAEGKPESERIDGVEVRRITMPRYRGESATAYVGSYGRFFLVAGALLCTAHAKQRFDIVHVHTMPDFMVFVGLLPRLSGAKVVLDMHDLMPDLYAVKFGLDRQGPLVGALLALQRAATTFADAVISVHEPQYKLLLRDGVPARKLAVVMNAADPKHFSARKAEPPIGPEGPIRLVYHGTVLHRYGVDLAVRAFARARESEPRLHMAILGDGDFMPDVRALAAELGLSPAVLELSGRRLPIEEVAAAIRSAHIGIIPNRDDQEDSVLPTKLLEYVAVGIPAVATRTRCISRFFTSDVVELVPVGDTEAMAQGILRLAREPARRAALVAGGRRWNEEYGFETQKRLLFRTIDALCFEKVAATKRAAQAAVEGVKTGKRTTPPKGSASREKGPSAATQASASASGSAEPDASVEPKRLDQVAAAGSSTATASETTPTAPS